MSDKRLDAFDTGFEHGKGINTNPVKEKLTLESVVEVIRDNTLTSDGIRLLTNFLKQIQDEILMDYNGITDNNTVRHINKVFNKYLNN